jgi:hypothetical protein
MAIVFPSGTQTGPAKIIQVVSQNYSTRFASSGNGWGAITNFNASITPQSTSNKILVTINLGVVTGNYGDVSCAFRIKRGSTVVLQGINQNNNRDECSFRLFSGVNSNHGAGISWSGIDSPSTTSSVTYSVDINPQDGTIFAVNYDYPNANVNDAYAYDCMSNITLMEVAS